MWSINFKTAYRTLINNKGYTFINIFGLSFGIGAVILLLLYIDFEYKFDNFHKEMDNIYRISVKSYHENNFENESFVFTPPIGPELKQTFPEVEDYTRHSTERPFNFNIDNNPITVEKVIYADATFLNFFTFDLLYGHKSGCLSQPNEIIITEKTAKKLFGKIDVVGKSLKVSGKKDYLITAIVANPPANSTIQFDALVSFATLYSDPNNYMGWNGGNQYITYIKLKDNVNANEFQSKIPDFMWEHINKDLAEYNVKYEPYLQPLQDVHLVYGESGLTNIYFFSFIGILILIIASFNFINLTTSQYTKRAKEVGVRKVAGANRRQIIAQFLFETLIIVFIALLLGVFLAKLITPVYRELMQTDFFSINLLDPMQISALLTLLLVIGVIAGSYPSLYLSSVDVVQALYKGATKRYRHLSFRNFLILLQFTISILLITLTLLINQQLNFINNKKLGFDKENIINLRLENEKARTQTELIKQRLKTISGVISVTASSEVPSYGFTSNGYFPEGYSTPVMINVLDIDEDFFDTYNIALTKGAQFSKALASDDAAYIINESLANQLDWENPIGKTIERDGKHPIIGVIKDFNFASLHEPISPLIITNQPWKNEYRYLSLKVKTSDYKGLITEIRNEWKAINPLWSFEYSFLDNTIAEGYTKENNLMKLFLFFSILAITIAGLGLYSLSALSVEQRTKEIGIRKVLGASVTNITTSILRKYIVIVLLSNSIAWPVAYYFINSWLSSYAYKISINWWFFVLAGIAALLIALVSVGGQIFRTARQNPVESLKYE